MVLMRVCPWCRRTEPWRQVCACWPEPSGAPLLRAVEGADRAVAVHDYNEVLRRFVLAAKNGGRPDLLRRFGLQLSATAAALNASPSATVSWVPASRHRRRRRGYDQGRVLARMVGHTLGQPVRPLLGRAGGDAQEGRTRANRLIGPRIRCRVGRSPHEVILVDDVITTGASMAAAASALRGSGTTTIIGIAIASSQ